MKIYGERAKIGANCSTGQNWISTGQNWCSTGQNRAIFGFALLQQGKVSSTGQKQGITGRPVLSGQFGNYESGPKSVVLEREWPEKRRQSRSKVLLSLYLRDFMHHADKDAKLCG